MTEAKSIALCGAGMISGAHAMAAHVLGIPVVAVASRSREKSAERANQLNAKSVEYSQLPSGADVVIVATPPAQHFDHAVYSLQRGAAVIIEKPLAYTLNEADRLVSHAEQNDQKILYAENLAYAPIVHAFIKRATTIGTVTHMSLRTVQSLPQWGGFTTAEWGGGALFDLGVHPLAIAVLVGRAIGAGEVTLRHGDGRTETVKADTLVVSLGRTPVNSLARELMGKKVQVQVVGDARTPRSYGNAIHEAAYLARQI